MKKSIKIRLAVTYIGIMCISLVVMLLVNSLFLEKVYLYKKTESLKKVYNTMNDTEDAVVNVLGHVLPHMHPSRIIQVQSQCDMLLVVQ